MFCVLSGCPPLLFVLTRHLCISRFQWHRHTYSAKKQEKHAQIWLKNTQEVMFLSLHPLKNTYKW